MLGFVKMSAISALLSFGIVTFYDQAAPPAAETGSGKLYLDRLPSDLEDDRTIGAPGQQPQAAIFRPGREGAPKGDRLPDAGSGAGTHRNEDDGATSGATRDSHRDGGLRQRCLRVRRHRRPGVTGRTQLTEWALTKDHTKPGTPSSTRRRPPSSSTARAQADPVAIG